LSKESDEFVVKGDSVCGGKPSQSGVKSAGYAQAELSGEVGAGILQRDRIAVVAERREDTLASNTSFAGGSLRGVAVRSAAWKSGDSRNEGDVLVAPLDDDPVAKGLHSETSKSKSSMI